MPDPLSDASNDDTSKNTLRRYGPLVLIAILGVGASGGLAYLVEQHDHQEKRAEAQLQFRKKVENAGDILQRTLSRHFNKLYSLRDFYRSVPRVSRDRFRTFVDRATSDNDAVQAMVWQERVTDEERAAYRRRMRAAGYPDFRITGLDREPLPPNYRDVYFPATYLVPMEGNEEAFGFDSFDRPSERRAIQQAIAQDTLTISGRIRLVQETQNQAGFVGYLPVYSANGPRADGTTPSTVDGLVLAVFRIPDLVRTAMNLVDRPFDALLLDTTAPKGKQYLGHYRNATHEVRFDPPSQQGLAATIDERCPQRSACTYTFNVGQHQWTLQAVPPVGYFRFGGTESFVYIFLMGLLLTAGVVGFVYYRQRHLEQVQELAAQVQEEKENAERLLLNILPEEVADELKRTGQAAPVRYESATVFFADFVDFTSTAEALPASALVDELDQLFSAFDQIVEEHGLEKIKTLGDAYMAAGGVPVSNDTHAEDCIRAALDMLEHLRAFNEGKIGRDGDRPRVEWEMRVGISSGPLIAGVIGDAKFTYDVFGDTVVTARRVESAGVPDQVNISAATRALVDDGFTFEERGKVQTKGKGRISMYLVEPEEPSGSGGDASAG